MALVSAEQLLLLKIHCPRAIGLPKNSSNPIFTQLNKKTKTIFPFALLLRTEVKSIAFKRGVLTLTRHLTNYQRHLQSTREFQHDNTYLNICVINTVFYQATIKLKLTHVVTLSVDYNSFSKYLTELI